LRTLQLRRLLNNQTDEEVDRLLATIEDELTMDQSEVFAIDHDILARGEGPGQVARDDRTAPQHATKASAPSTPQPPSTMPKQQVGNVTLQIIRDWVTHTLLSFSETSIPA